MACELKALGVECRTVRLVPGRGGREYCEYCTLEAALEGERGVLAMTVAQLGGEVEGRPTERVNFLQRIGELREIERKYVALMQALALVQADDRKTLDGPLGRMVESKSSDPSEG